MGEYAHTIDAKGRVILPADFRAELGEHFFIVKGLDQCLYIYGENEWASFVQKVRQLRGFRFHDLYVKRVFHDVVLRSGNAGTLVQGDDAVLFEEQQRSGFVGGVVGYADLDDRRSVRIAGAAGGESKRESKC